MRSNPDKFSEVCTDFTNTKIYPLFDTAFVFQHSAYHCQTSRNKTECRTSKCLRSQLLLKSLPIHHMKVCIQLLHRAKLFQIELLAQRINIAAAQTFFFFSGEIKHIAQIYRINKKCILSESHRIQSVSSMPKVIITRATNYFHCYGAFARITLICIATETLNLLQ